MNIKAAEAAIKKRIHDEIGKAIINEWLTLLPPPPPGHIYAVDVHWEVTTGPSRLERRT